MMFVYVDTRTSGHCVSIAVTPKMTAHELRRRALEKASTASCTDEENFDDENDDFVLHEVVLGGAMERPIHHAELIYEVQSSFCIVNLGMASIHRRCSVYIEGFFFLINGSIAISSQCMRHQSRIFAMSMVDFFNS